MNDQWDGIERRTASALDQFKQLLKSHTEDEMDRYDQIINKINHNDEASNERHDETQRRVQALTDSVNAFMENQSGFIDAIKRAFPKDDEGRPDYDGHRTAHLAWIQDSKDSKELKKYIQKVVLGAAAVAVLSWLWAVVWPAFLAGPK